MSDGERKNNFFNLTVQDQFAYLIPGAVFLVVSFFMLWVIGHLYVNEQANAVGGWKHFLNFCRLISNWIENRSLELFSGGTFWNALIILVVFLILAYATGILIHLIRDSIPLAWRLRDLYYGAAAEELILQKNKRKLINKILFQRYYFTPETLKVLRERILRVNNVDTEKEINKGRVPNIQEIWFANRFWRTRFATLHPPLYQKRDRSSDRPSFNRQLIAAVFFPLTVFLLIGWLPCKIRFFLALLVITLVAWLCLLLFVHIHAAKEFMFWHHYVYQYAFYDNWHPPQREDVELRGDEGEGLLEDLSPEEQAREEFLRKRNKARKKDFRLRKRREKKKLKQRLKAVQEAIKKWRK